MAAGVVAALGGWAFVNRRLGRGRTALAIGAAAGTLMAAELLREVSESGHAVTITQNGEARAVLMDVDTYDRWRSAMALLHAEAERRGLPWLTLLRFCEEGNNIPDGQQLAQALVRAGACGTAGAVRWATPSCWALVSGPLRHFVRPF